MFSLSTFRGVAVVSASRPGNPAGFVQVVEKYIAQMEVG